MRTATGVRAVRALAELLRPVEEAADVKHAGQPVPATFVAAPFLRSAMVLYVPLHSVSRSVNACLAGLLKQIAGHAVAKFIRT
jgi:hypothetical protein